ncbi:MAG: hypothetical protein JSS12_04555 [Verrucomicrobia bacterium]|nr:hypothetical protein [Verrucomicrobiota bacterium]
MALIDLFLHLLGYPDIPHLLARVWGILLMALSLGLFINKKCYLAMLRSVDKQLILFVGLLALATGVLTIIFHNVWQHSWVVVITLFGWGSFIFGLVMTIVPQLVCSALNKTAYLLWVVSPLCIVLSGLLIYKGFEDRRAPAVPPIPPEISSLEVKT